MYQILFTKQAMRTMLKIPHDTAFLIREKLNQIANDPFSSHSNAAKLQGRPGYRLRVGDWRVLYEINNNELTIIALKVAPRGEVYR